MTKTEELKMKKMEMLLTANGIAVPKEKDTMTMTKEVEVKITKEEWELFKEVQNSGLCNMYSPDARNMVGVSKVKWMTMMEYYDELSEKYGEE